MENQEFIEALKNNKIIKSFMNMLIKRGDERLIPLKLKDDKVIITSPNGKGMIVYQDPEIEKITALYKWENNDDNKNHVITVKKDYEVSEMYINFERVLKKYFGKNEKYSDENISDLISKYNLKPFYRKLLKILKMNNSEKMDIKIDYDLDSEIIVGKNDKFKIVIMIEDLEK